MKRPLVLIAAALACASCSRKEKEEGPVEMAMIIPPPPGVAAKYAMSPAADAAAAPAADAAAAPAMAAEPAAADASPAMRIAAGHPMLAYSYSYGLSLPHRQVDAMRRRHEQACVAAGYRVCQVVSTSIRDQGNGAVRGDLAMRAAPTWLKTFRDGLEGDAKGAGGRIDTSDVTSEDLSREIVDTEAQLRAKLTLRDRLQALLADRPGRLADLLSVERELARVQGEIDSTQSQLAVMRGRVAMSEISLSYAPGDLVGPTVRSPLSQSLGGFFGVMAASVAAMLDILAITTPWALLLGAIAWFFRRRLWKLLRFPGKAAPVQAV
ncbi:DUF4349 domain-containing protein [Phenylobacterium sp.]|uniref:DUF4349 domain-containing protein n=1 Tax=Phenylobacterium sp. TaxID=1871053 RepID=UPI002EDA505D